MADLIGEITYSDFAVDITLEAFALEQGLEFRDDFSVDDLLTYEGNDDRIYAAYNSADQAQYSSADKELLRANTTIKFPMYLRVAEPAAQPHNEVKENKEYKAFLSEKLEELLQHEGYKPITETQTGSTVFQSKAYRILNNCTVWIWSRVLDKMINVTPFVERVVTTVGTNGGNFSMNLAPIIAEFDANDGWVISKSSLEEYAWRGKKNYSFRESIIKQLQSFKRVASGVWEETGDVQDRRKLMYFHHILQGNDMVFIQFETLDMEKNQRVVDDGGDFVFSDGLDVSNAALPDRVFDLIGLIDVSHEGYNAANVEVGVSVTGRDLMKTVIEDGCYFFPLDYAQNEGGFIDASANTNGRAMKRLVTSELMFFNAFVDRSIEYSIAFVLNQLSNVEFVPSVLFSHYTNKSKRYEIKDPTLEGQENMSVTANPYTSNASDYTEYDAEGVWQIIKVAVDSEIADRRIVDSSITTDSGSLIGFFKKICQEPFVEFFGDTYGDQYHFVVRKPPYTQASVLDYIDRGLVVDIHESDIYTQELGFDDSEVYSWYHLVPMGSYNGDRQTAFVDFPPIFFDEYAKIWGSRPYQVTSNYVKYEQFQGKESEVNLDYMREQARNDLAFLIETTAYKPFTRKGTIQIKADRRIKRGMFVRHNGTGEIFHVDAVSNSYTNDMGSNDRETHLTVSRGMVEEYLEGANNYFNIIDLKKDANGVPTDHNFKVDAEVFNFFLTRQQFK